jgi:hypothetical protein
MAALGLVMVGVCPSAPPVCKPRTDENQPQTVLLSRMTRLFISHSSPDDAFVRDLRTALADQGQAGWVDTRELRGGDPLWPATSGQPHVHSEVPGPLRGSQQP